MKANIIEQRLSASLLKQRFNLLFILLLLNVFGVSAQPCPVYPGYTTWLGYTDVWEDSSNWCPAIAPLNINPPMNIRIPGGPSGPYTYFKPVIRSGVYALVQKLRIESGDTLFIDAAAQSSLIVSDSLKIESLTSALVVGASAVKFPIYVRGIGKIMEFLIPEIIE
jgi:hypothetical protein